MSVVALVRKEKAAQFYAEQIKRNSRETVRVNLERARLAEEAYRALSKSEFKKLAKIIKFSLSTLSKWRTIHRQRHRFEKNIDDCPLEWTTMYLIATFTDGQFDRFVADGKLHSNLTAKTVEIYSGLFQGESVSDDRGDGYTVIASVRVARELTEDQLSKLREEISTALKPVFKGHPARIDFPERKSALKEKNRKRLEGELQKLLAQQLAPYNAAKAGLSKNDYEVLDNAAWQHERRQKTGEYPYVATKPNSIEHSKHPYSINNKRFADCTKFRRYLLNRKIITPYFPIPEIPELGEAHCIQLAVQSCDGNARTRRSARQRLSDIRKGGSKNAAHAKKYIDMLESRGL
jgi:hypothetical protein